MRLSLDHVLTHRYSRDVFLDPIVLRLRPQADAYLALRSHQLEIDPTPAGRCQQLDAHGNAALFAWFDREHPSLTIRSRAEVDNDLVNPFDYFLSDDSVKMLPAAYGPRDHAALVSCLADPATEESGGQELEALVRDIRQASENQTLAFCAMLADWIHRTLPTIVRSEGAPWSPGRTLREGRGSCRDHAVLFMQACRRVGLAARFVSGYAFNPARQTEHELHAWAEVYLPGPGWRGYDPSLGLAVADAHVPIARAATHEGAAPLEGMFRGTDVASELAYEVSIRASESGDKA